MEVVKKASEVEGKIGDPQALKDSDIANAANEPATAAVTKTNSAGICLIEILN